MTEDQRILREHFLEPETRDGVFVSAELKRAWKVMLDMFEEFVRICDKYGLKYYMDGGTLLGAIRHRGFIPWDDDMDLVLFREDFQKFIEVAPNELKPPYFMQYTTTDPEHVQGFACLRNSETTGIDTPWAERHARFNMGIGIDIFPMDYVTDEPGELGRVLRRAKIFARLQAYAFYRGSMGLHEILRKFCACIVYALVGNKRLVRWRDQNFSSFDREKCPYCSTISYNLGKKRAMWKREVYDQCLLVPFEYLDVRVPAGYALYLATFFGANWRTPIKGIGDHAGIEIDTNVPYKRTLVKKYGYEPSCLKGLPGGM